LADQGDSAINGEFKIKPQRIDAILNESPNDNKRLLKQPTDAGGQVLLRPHDYNKKKIPLQKPGKIGSDEQSKGWKRQNCDSEGEFRMAQRMNTFGESPTESINGGIGRLKSKIGNMMIAHIKGQDNVGLKMKALKLNSRNKAGLKDSLLNVDSKGNRIGRGGRGGGTRLDRTMEETTNIFELPHKVGGVLDGDNVGGGGFFKIKKKRIQRLDLAMGEE
jgi:hypothetical protein